MSEEQKNFKQILSDRLDAQDKLTQKWSDTLKEQLIKDGWVPEDDDESRVFNLTVQAERRSADFVLWFKAHKVVLTMDRPSDDFQSTEQTWGYQDYKDSYQEVHEDIQDHVAKMLRVTTCDMEGYTDE